MTGILGGLIASIKSKIAWASVQTTALILTDYSYDTGNSIVVHDDPSASFKLLNISTGTTTDIIGDGGFPAREGSLAVGADSSVFAWTRQGELYKYQSGTVSLVSLTNGGNGLATNRSGTWLAVSGNDIAYSTNNMSSWTQTPNILGTITADSAAYMSISGTPTWAAFDSGTTSYYTSTNLSTWTSRTLPFTLLSWSGKNHVIADGGYAYAIAESTFNVWRTADFINWTDLGNPSGTTTQNTRKIAVSGSKIVYSYDYGTTSSNKIIYTWYSNNNGNSWNLLPFDTADNSGTFASYVQYYLGGGNSQFYISINAGTERYTSVSI